jgi:hypothetical protein
MKPLILKLRNVEYIANSPTVAEVQAFVSILLMGHTESLQLESLQQARSGNGSNIFGLDVTDPDDLAKVSTILYARQSLFESRCEIVRHLGALFPTLPESAIVNDGARSRLKLTFVELLNDVLMPVCVWLKELGEPEQEAIAVVEVAETKRKARSKAAIG